MFCCMQLWQNVGSRHPSKVVSDFLHQIHLDTATRGHETVLLKNGGRICGTGGAITTAPLVQSKSYFEVKIQQGGAWSVGLATRKADLSATRGGQDAESWCLGSDNRVWHDGRQLYAIGQQQQPDGSSLTTTTQQPTFRRTASEDGDGDIGNATGAVAASTDADRLVDTSIAQAVVSSPPTAAGEAMADGGVGGVPVEGDTLGVAYDHVELNFYLNGKQMEVPVLNVRGTVYPCIFVDDGAVLDLITNNFNYAPPPGFNRIMIEQSLL